MAAISFPSSPTTNQVFTSGNKSWIWDGTAWRVLNPTVRSLVTYSTINFGTASAAAMNMGTPTSTIFPELSPGLNYRVNAFQVLNSLVVNGSTTIGGNTTIGGSSRIANSLGVGTDASGTIGEIRAYDNVTAYYSSDVKFKENIRNIPNAMDKVDAIGGKLFDWTDEYIDSHGGADGYFIRKSDFGVIAQDVQAVFPEAVRTRPNGTLAVDYEKLAALAFAALVELSARVKVLEGK